MTTITARKAETKPLPALTTQELSIRDRRKRKRVKLPPMYTAVTVRALHTRRDPLDGHALDLSESGMSVQLDDMLPPGSPVTIEFMVAGLGQGRRNQWPTFAATAEVTRLQDVDDFPQGPYNTALRFVKVPTIVQAQIARYIAARTPAR